MKALPTVPHTVEPSVRMFLQEVKERIEVLGGLRGNVREHALLSGAMAAIGIVNIDNKRVFNPATRTQTLADHDPIYEALTSATGEVYVSATGGTYLVRMA